MKAFEVLLIVMLVLVTASLAARNQPEAMTPSDLEGHVRVLSSDAMEGRRTGTPGAERAAAYLEEEFSRLRLDPGGDEGSYRQAFDARVGARMGDENRLLIQSPEGPTELTLDADWRPLAFAVSTDTTLRASVVFCGYGITSTDPPYDDYEKVDVGGCVVLCLRLEPGADDAESPFDGTALTFHSDLRNKAKNAFDHGAVGFLCVTGQVTDGKGQDLLPFDDGAGAGSGHLPAAQIGQETLAQILDTVDLDLAAIQTRIDQSYRPHSLPLDLTVVMEVDVEPVEAHAFNLVGILPGSDPDHRDETILVGAHYDHLGHGGAGSLAPDSDAIHNGADDNASGVTAMLEIAESLSAAPDSLRRTVVFAAFTGEEMGLLGSTHYVEHASVPLATTRAMVNIDMIGRGQDRQILVGGVGTSPGFQRLVEEEAEAVSLVPVFIESGYGPSDHTPFYSKEMPVLFFFTQPHEDYHRPTDDWQKVDYDYLGGATRLVGQVVARLASEETEIPFTRADDGAPPSRDRRGGEGYGKRGYGTYLGTVPDFTPSDEGVRLTGVRDGSPAAVAGIRGGDTIIGWSGRQILNLQDYAQALRSQRPGDQVEILLLRDGEQVTVTATLGERR
jgi:hypothetical protein